MRPPRRQGARPDEPVRAHARRCAARGGRPRRPRADRRPHGRALGLAPDERRRRRRPRALHRRADARGVLPRPGRDRGRGRPRARLCAVRRPRVVRTSTPDMEEAEQFAAAIHERYPGKLLAYNCSPSFNWRKHLSDTQIAGFQRDLARMGYRFQFITLAGFHALNLSMFELATGYRDDAMSAYVALQERVRSRGRGLHRDPPPARGRRRVLRPGDAGRLGRRLVDARPDRLDRGTAIPRRKERRMSTTLTREKPVKPTSTRPAQPSPRPTIVTRAESARARARSTASATTTTSDAVTTLVVNHHKRCQRDAQAFAVEHRCDED